MKQPLDPDVFHARQLRNGYAVKVAACLLGIGVIAAIFALALWLAWGNEDALFLVSMFGLVLCILAVVPLVWGIADFGGEMIDYHREMSGYLNQRAWDSQQEELKRLRRIMKEEGL